MIGPCGHGDLPRQLVDSGPGISQPGRAPGDHRILVAAARARAKRAAGPDDAGARGGAAARSDQFVPLLSNQGQ
eukprot:125006-Hanusia_phi.AAC.1